LDEKREKGTGLCSTRQKRPVPFTATATDGLIEIASPAKKRGGLAMTVLLITGCARLFGWEIHAPGILSSNFAQQIRPVEERAALYLPSEVLTYQSKDKGSWSADPQTYHVGEALAPMLLEGFQNGFSEFVFLETEPTASILRRYGIKRLAVVRIKDFKNRVTWGGQGLMLITETAVFDSEMKKLAQFESRGSSESEKIFAKKGGPEVNLNAAIENNVRAVVQHLQDMK